MDSFPSYDPASGLQGSAERTRALLMVERARVPIYFAMAQVAIVSITIPAALGFKLLAAMGFVIFLSL